MLTVSYFSAGVSSAVATKLIVKAIDKIMYTHIDDQHPDTMRFVTDCEKWFGKPVEVWQSHFKSVDEVLRKERYVRGFGGSPCTKHLKRFVRKRFEAQFQGPLRLVWGYDITEEHRAERIVKSVPEHDHVFPLIDNKMTKENAHEILRAAGIARPAMYELGYRNNNCVGCVKGGAGYWNKIRVDFPEVFEARSNMERAIGFHIVRGKWLTELPTDAGRNEPPVDDECNILCEIMTSL